MPLSDDFLLTQMTIDFVDNPRSRAHLVVDPDDVRARGLNVFFQNVGQVARMDDATVMLWWQHDRAPALRGLEPFEAVDASVGNFKVHWPSAMGQSGGTVTAKIVVTEDDRKVAVPLPKLEVAGVRVDPSATPSEDTFSVLARLLDILENGIVDVEDVTERATLAAQSAELAANNANAAARETRDGEEERRQTFESSQAANRQAFDDALEKMKSDHADEERAHEEAFDTAQTQRQGSFEEDERARQTSFETAEEERRQTFDTAEAKRQRDHEDEEAAHAKAFEDAEAKRQSDHEAEEARHERAFGEAETAREAAVDEAVAEADAATERADASSKRADASAAGADSSAQIAYRAAQDADAARESLQGLETDVEAAERDRVAAEAERAERQDANDTRQARNNADQAANNLAAQGVIEVWLEDPSQYDPVTRQPTVEAENGKRYNTPAPDPEEGNEWLEWKPRFKPDGSYEWELIGGSGSRPPDPMTTGQVDRIVAGEDVEGTQTLNATVASYYEKARRAKDATLYDAKGAAEAARSDAVGASAQALADAIREQGQTDSQQDEAMVEAMAAIGKAQTDATAALGDAKGAQDAADRAQRAADDAKGAADDVGGDLAAHITEQEARDSDQDTAIEEAKRAGTEAQSALDTYKGDQKTRDDDQDSAIEAARQAAEDAKASIPKTVTSETPGIVPAYPPEGLAYLCIDRGGLGWRAVPVVTTDAPGLIPTLPDDKHRFLNGVGQWVEVEAGGGGADPTELRALIAEAKRIHDTAWTGSQADPTLHSWQNTAEAIEALQTDIDAAQSVDDEFWVTVFRQRPLDDARDALQAALETFESTGTEVLPNLDEFESLKARVKAVDDETTVDADGKGLTFGTKWVTQGERDAAKGAVDACQSSIESATKQSQIDTACDTLETAVAKYEGQVRTATADTAALDEAIGAARKTREGVVVSEDGSELEPGSRYVTDQATLDAIDEAIETATAAKTGSTTQAQLDAATSALEKATGEFDSKVQQNLKIPQSSEELEVMSWEEIAQLSAAAAKDPTDFLFMTDASHKLEKNVRMTGISGVADVKARIIGVGQDVDENGEKIGLTFQLCDGLECNQPVAMQMNSSNSTTGGWRDSLMRSTNLPKIEAALPADLKSRLKTMVKKTNISTSGSTMTETQDKLALLSCVEVFGPTQSNYGSSQSGFQSWYPLEGEWYQWYQQHNTDGDRIIKRASGSADHWWLRSVQSSRGFAIVSSSGVFAWGNATGTCLPCACFSV